MSSPNFASSPITISIANRPDDVRSTTLPSAQSLRAEDLPRVKSALLDLCRSGAMGPAFKQFSEQPAEQIALSVELGHIAPGRKQSEPTTVQELGRGGGGLVFTGQSLQQQIAELQRTQEEQQKQLHNQSAQIETHRQHIDTLFQSNQRLRSALINQFVSSQEATSRLLEVMSDLFPNLNTTTTQQPLLQPQPIPVPNKQPDHPQALTEPNP